MTKSAPMRRRNGLGASIVIGLDLIGTVASIEANPARGDVASSIRTAAGRSARLGPAALWAPGADSSRVLMMLAPFGFSLDSATFLRLVAATHRKRPTPAADKTTR